MEDLGTNLLHLPEACKKNPGNMGFRNNFKGFDSFGFQSIAFQFIVQGLSGNPYRFRCLCNRQAQRINAKPPNDFSWMRRIVHCHG